MKGYLHPVVQVRLHVEKQLVVVLERGGGGNGLIRLLADGRESGKGVNLGVGIGFPCLYRPPLTLLV